MRLLERALSLSTAEETDIYLSSQDLGLTRFAGNAIHQNVSHSNVTLNIRAVEGQRLGRATTNDTSDDGIRRAMESAQAQRPADARGPGIPRSPGAAAAAARVASWDESAAACSPLTRAQMVGEVCRQGAAEGLDTAGACRTGVHEIAVVSSRGVRAYHAGTFAGPDHHHPQRHIGGLGQGRLVAAGRDRLSRPGPRGGGQGGAGQGPAAHNAPASTVVLDHYAVDDILEALSLYGMGAQAVQEGRSWMCGIAGHAGDERVGVHLGRRRVAWTAGQCPSTWRGCRAAGWNWSRTAWSVRRYTTPTPQPRTAWRPPGTSSISPARPSPPTCSCSPGDKSVDELIASTERGLYITRFFYTRLSHNRGCVMTGMTRDGTFLIEDGEMRHPVKDLRFTQSYVDALNGVEGVGDEAKLVLNEVGFATRVPALKLASFNFTGLRCKLVSEILSNRFANRDTMS